MKFLDIKTLKWLLLLGVVISVVIIANIANTKEDDRVIRIGTISGPTGFGMVKLFENENYDFSIFSSPEEVVSKVIANELDITSLPTNLAATLYNKTNGKVKILSVNALGNLYIVTTRDDINEVSDLEGKTIILAGKNATPDFVINKLTSELNVNIEYKSEHAEVVSLLKTGKNDIGLLPEPFVTIANTSVENLNIALDLSKIWEDEFKTVLPMGCIIINSELSSDKRFVQNFLKEYKNSIDFVLNNNEEAAKLITQYEIFSKEEVAKNSIPRCNIAMITGTEMKEYVKEYINIINNYSPNLIGGTMPDEEFYY